ncbi:MAG: hypothetical protein R2911_26170 [Caldilineaceae bacterium]
MALGAGELGAFRAYADVYPDDCLLLVDTIDTLHSGIPNAITVFEELKRNGHKPVGVAGFGRPGLFEHSGGAHAQ